MRDYVDFLARMLEIYSPSGEEEKLSRFLAKELESLGFDVRIDEAMNVIAEVGDGRPIVLLCGHLDAVPGMIPVRIDEGKLYGRGAVDAKGPLAAAIIGASNFVAKKRKGKIIIAACVEEESTGKGIKYFIRSNPELNADYAIIVEPSGIDRITIGYRGRVLLKLACETKGGHAGSHWLFTNAVEESIKVWEKLREKWLKRREKKEKFRSVSACLTRIKGGEYSNIVPSRCEMTIDVRVPPGLSYEMIIDEAKEIVSSYKAKEASFSIEVEDKVDPFEARKPSKLIASLRRAIRDVIKRPAILTRKTGSSDMAILAKRSRFTVAYGPGDPRSEHRLDECISISEFLMAIEVYKRTLELLLS